MGGKAVLNKTAKVRKAELLEVGEAGIKQYCDQPQAQKRENWLALEGGLGT